MKGHLKIELKDVNTGEVEEHEQDNMVTDAMANLLGLSAISSGISNSGNTKLLYYLIPIAQKGLGGIFLFDGNLEERKDNIHFPMDVHLTGSAGRVSNTESKIIGSYNSTESHKNDNGFTSVWDFGTSQANGTIASLALTNYSCGGDPFLNTIQSTDKFETDYSYQPIAYDSEKGILYLYYMGKIYSKRTYSHIIGVNSPELSSEEQVFDFNFSTSNYNYWVVCNGYDGYIYAIYCSSTSTKKTVTFKIRKIKVSDFSFTDEGEQIISVDNVTCYGTTNPDYRLFISQCVSRGYLYFRSYDSYTLYKVNLSNIVDIKEIKFGDDVGVTYIYPKYNGGVYADFNYYAYSSSGTRTKYYSPGFVYPDGEFLYKEENRYSDPQYTYYYIGFEADNLLLNKMGSSNSSYLEYGFVKNYLGTICNLASPVTKTSAQTMKITYTLTDA